MTNFRFIVGRAFAGLEDVIAKRLGQGGFGFDQMSEKCQVSADGLLRLLKPEDLVAFALIPKLIGRLLVIAPLDALGVDGLTRIRQSTKGSLIQQFQNWPGSKLRIWCSRIRRATRLPGSPLSVAQHFEVVAGRQGKYYRATAD
jgi:ATP-dependent protease Clp ATPase subunit